MPLPQWKRGVGWLVLCRINNAASVNYRICWFGMDSEPVCFRLLTRQALDYSCACKEWRMWTTCWWAKLVAIHAVGNPPWLCESWSLVVLLWRLIFLVVTKNKKELGLNWCEIGEQGSFNLWLRSFSSTLVCEQALCLELKMCLNQRMTNSHWERVHDLSIQCNRGK
jgi:hypothetical protein